MKQETLTPEEAQNLANYFASVTLEYERIMSHPATDPIGDEYCWEHNEREEDGGWFCVDGYEWAVQLVCREQAAMAAFMAVPSYVERYTKGENA